MIPADQGVFVPMPDEMVDIIAASCDFEVPERGSDPVWLEINDDNGRTLRLIIVRPKERGELWVLAPRSQ